MSDKYIPPIWEIEDLRQKIDKFKPHYERNFTKRYCEFGKKDFYLDICISMFETKMCQIYLADGHTIIKNEKEIKYLNFSVGGENQLKMIQRKRYRNGRPVVSQFQGEECLVKNSVICYIETHDGGKYPVCAGIPGYLIDVNKTAFGDYSKLVEAHNTTGYIAMIYPANYTASREEILDGLLTREEYENVLALRDNN